MHIKKNKTFAIIIIIAQFVRDKKLLGSPDKMKWIYGLWVTAEKCWGSIKNDQHFHHNISLEKSACNFWFSLVVWIFKLYLVW